MYNKILQFKLRFLAQLYLRRYHPTIIAVTGNAGKTSTKEAIGVVVGVHRRVRVSMGNLNNEFGVPLTIIGNWDKEYYEKGSSLWFWFKVLVIGYLLLIFKKNYPEVLILEYGADRPGDIKRLVQSYPPHIGVITTVGDVPVHVEHFKNTDSVAREKSELVQVLKPTDFAILNHDDERVFEMHKVTKARVFNYGFNEKAQVRVSDFEYRSNEEGEPQGVTFKLHYDSSFIPVYIDGSLGKSQAWAAASAAAVGVTMGLNLVQISQALTNYHGPKGRMKIIKGVNGSIIIDDTYNASPASTHLALDVLRDLPAIRKIAVLGDMLELGEHTIPAHRAVGAKVSSIVDTLVCVGSRAKFIAESASSLMSEEQIITFETSEEAANKIPDIIRRHDLILVKGSQGIRMEKITKAVMADSSQAKELLVRQSKSWLKK
jgi:UDP-N-acetylmuramoyl-tripeptide--D-alanyl-D-alanine ligase